MSLFPGGFFGGGGGGAAAYEIEKSLRFRASASAYLQRTFGTPTSTTIWTYSKWVKRGALTGTFRLFGASTNTFLTFNASDQINLTLNGTSAATSTAVFRDPSAHYHIVYQQNGSTQTIWVNNVSVATGTTAAAVFNTAIAHQIGAANTSNFFDGYLSEINFIDGQALTPSSFGEFDANGVWVPKAYTGTYGTNGFYLPFNDGTNLTELTKDRSGNANNWTANNISLTAGATYDWMDDTPTNNFAVLNPLLMRWSLSNTSLSHANLQTTNVTDVGVGLTLGTTYVSAGKFYFEASITAAGLLSDWFIAVDSGRAADNVFTDVAQYIASTGAITGAAAGATYGVGDIIGVALNKDTNQVSFYKNNVLQGTANVPINVPMTALLGPGRNGGSGWANFGQRPFAYTPPSGFLPLCTKNLTNTTITTSGSFTGNANADGPFVWLNGVPTAMTINGNAVTFATHADRTAGGFKVRTSSASYNVSGTNNYTITTTGAAFKNARAQVNP
jgi:hypothetical protein